MNLLQFSIMLTIINIKFKAFCRDSLNLWGGSLAIGHPLAAVIILEIL